MYDDVTYDAAVVPGDRLSSDYAAHDMIDTICYDDDEDLWL